jgi:hypothetical protein
MAINEILIKRSHFFVPSNGLVFLIKVFFFQFTMVSSRDESNCLNGESECPPIVDKSTIECPQI